MARPRGIAEHQLPANTDAPEPARGAATPNLHAGADLGQALQAIREHQGLTLEAMAGVTRVRRAYLADIEAMRLERLPSRPFTIGYIRAYAEALGQSGDAAVERFKAEEPDFDEPLQAPVGLADIGDPRVAAIIASVIVLLASIIIWNIAQRTVNAGAPPPPTASAKAAAMALAAPPTGAIVLGAPLPAPVESTTPPLYQTPGLPDSAAPAAGQGPATTSAAKFSGDPQVDVTKLPRVFTAGGAIDGAPPGQASPLVLQALKSVSLIVRGADGSIYFARQFSPGEAYRAPAVTGLIAEVSEPTHFQVFVAGQSRGVLPAAQTSLTQLAQ